MNQPTGFDIVNGAVTNVNPTAAMLTNRAFPYEFTHGALAAYVAMGLAIAGVYAFAMLRGDRSEYNKKAIVLGLGLVAVFAPLQVVTGDLSARHLAHHQPEKFAAMEGQFSTVNGEPLRIGGIPFPGDHETQFRHLDTEAGQLPGVRGLQRPGPAASTASRRIRYPTSSSPTSHSRSWSRSASRSSACRSGSGGLPGGRRGSTRGGCCCSSSSPCRRLGFVAIEAGWFVTEFGRQPWIIYHVMETSGGVTPRQGIWVLLLVFAVRCTLR